MWHRLGRPAGVFGSRKWSASRTGKQLSTCGFLSVFPLVAGKTSTPLLLPVACYYWFRSDYQCQCQCPLSLPLAVKPCSKRTDHKPIAKPIPSPGSQTSVCVCHAMPCHGLPWFVACCMLPYRHTGLAVYWVGFACFCLALGPWHPKRKTLRVS